MLEVIRNECSGRIHTLGQGVTSVQWDTVGGIDSRVESALGVVDGLGNEVQAKGLVTIQVVQKTPSALVAVVEGGVGGAVVVVEGKSLPLGDVVAGNRAVVGSSSGVTGQVGDNGHGLDANHTLEGKVGLVTKG